MNPELHKFAQQLSLWTNLIIENGRTPFRRVDLYPEIHTDRGILRPPLVFWINRQSMMAGGILLLPEKDLAAELQRGCSCCDALGLKYFVTWESDQVRIWRREGDKARQHQQFGLQHAEHPDSFRHLLGEVLEALKLLAVIGLVPNGELSPHYLHNLFLTTLDVALPALINSYRSLRAEEGTSPAEDADQLANEANRLLLLQLLGLAWHQQLPAAILPEKLERAIQLSLPQLPEPLLKILSLKVTATPPELPHETAVCFHHLLLRLRQLSWRQPEDRAILSIQLLIDSWNSDQAETADEVQIYPLSPVLGAQTQLILSDSLSLLAAVRLLEDLQQKKPQQLLLGNLFQLDYAGRTGLSINGTINKQRLLSREERHQYTTLLRTSWPNRRFRIGGDKPLWFWELIHLLGLSKQQRQLTLILPRAIVQSSIEEPFWLLFWESYSICRIAVQDNDLIKLELIPEAGQNDSIVVHLGSENRTILAINGLAIFRNQLLLTLLSPTGIYRLLGNKLVWPDKEDLDTDATEGLKTYLQSRLSRRIEKILGLDLKSLHEEEYQQALLSFPRPDLLHLKEISRLNSQRDDLDSLLAGLLQVPAIESLEIPAAEQSKVANPRRAPDKELRDQLVKQLQDAGIPNFPEQYLYFLDSQETTSYQLNPPLRITSELLGETILEAADGEKLQVYGEELANALLLCSDLDKSDVELPLDRHQLALIQQQYWKDLKQLHKQLSSLCHSHLKSPQAADRLAKKVWKKLCLPKLK